MGQHRLKMLLLSMLGMTTLQGVFAQGPPPTVYRLPSTITPQLYMLRLEPDMDNEIVKGTVMIQINTTSDTNQTVNTITLHMGTDVTVNETSGVILDMDGKVQIIGAFIYDNANTLLTLKLPEGQTLGYNHLYVISLQFQSILNTEPKGLFVGYFNSTSKYVASNFRPTHARDVFPCFDEPHFKVPVALQVLRPASYYAISTAPLDYSLNVSADTVLDTFSNTEAISIHSLGLFIGDQPSVKSMGVNVIVPPSYPSTVIYLETLIANISNKFGSFPQTPLSLIVLPDKVYTSFSSYGFVFTSPEVYLGEVGSPLQWTSLQLQLTEEFLRQYLEYSKTPQWWSDLWLSESVGAYLAIPFQQNEPWLQDWLRIVIRSKALGEYTGTAGPVITTEDLTKWDIENIISNQAVKYKGLSTLLMWTDTMPKGLVMDTITDFIKLPQSVVSTDDLVSLMVANIRKSTLYNVTATIPLLPNWLTQPGSPLVWFNIDSNTTFTLDQETPCPAGSAALALRPISVAVAEGSFPDWSDFRQGNWLLDASAQYTFSNTSQALSGIVINIETAPYRVNYNGSQWTTLLRDLSTEWAPVAVASALRDDAVALSIRGCLDFSTALSLLNSTQPSSLGWWPVVKTVDAITAKIGSDWYGFTALGSYFANLFTADLLEQLDVRNNTNSSELIVTRELVTPWLCRFDISSCREAVVELGGSLWQGNTSGIAVSDLKNVACYGARYTPGALQPLLNAYQSTEDASLRRYFTIALSCLIEQSSVNTLLGIIINRNSSSTQTSLASQVTLSASDASQILIGLASSLENSQAVINFVLNQITDIQAKFGVITLSSVIKNLANHRADLSELNSLQDKSLDLDPFVVQSIDEALVSSNFSQTWYFDYSSQLYNALPVGQTTEAPTSTTITTTTMTTSKPTPGPTSSTTSKPAPGGAPAISDFRVFTMVLTFFLIAVNIAV